MAHMPDTDIAELDSLDEVLASMTPIERDAAIQELEKDGLWDQ